MAAAYITISCDRGEIRKYGGNVSDVRAMKRHYENLSLAEFMHMHPYCCVHDYNTLKVSKVTRKR